MAKSYHILIDKLDEFIRKYYKNQLVKGGIYSVSLVLGFFISVSLLEYFARFETLGRAIVFYSFLTLSIAILIKYIAIPVSKLYKIGAVISHEQAASIIGSHFSNIQDKLLNVLQLNKQFIAETDQSSGLLEASINQKIEELKPVPFVSAVDLSENKKYIKYALMPVGAIIIILFASPSIITESTKRIVDYKTYYEKPAPFRFIIQNASLTGVQNDDFLIEIKILGEILPDNAFIEFENTRLKLDKEGKLNFSYLFKNLQKSLFFKLEADGVYSEEFELSVIPNPIVLDFTVNLEYPKYIGKKDEVLKNTGDLIIPEGTKVKWKFNTRNTRSIQITTNDSTVTVQPFGTDQYNVSRTFFKNSNYSIKTANEFVTSKDSVAYNVQVISDQYPSIEVEERADSLSSKRIYFRGSIKDDYGFKRLTFSYKKSNVDSAKSIHQELLFNKSANSDQFYHFWDLNEMNIQTGDEIEYYFEVWDNDGINGSKVSRTQKMIFKAPSLKDIAANTEKANTEIKKDLESSLKEAKEIQKQINELNKKLLEKKTLGWDDKKKVESLIQKHKNLQKNIEEIKKQNKENMFKQSEYKDVDERIVDKQEKLQELFEKVMTEEMKEMMKQLEKLLEQMDKNKIQEAMDQMKYDAKDLEKELDRSLELFKQMEFEQKAMDAVEKLKDLSKKQKELSEKAEDKKTNQEELLKKQEELNKEFQDMKKDLEDLNKKNQELEEPNKMPDSKELQKEVDKEQKESKENLKDNKNKKAAENQKNAADKMEEMAEQLESAMESNEEEQSEEDINALRSILNNLVRLSHEQEGVMNSIKKTDRNDPVYLALTQAQKKLKDDAKLIEDSLFALSKRVPQLSAIINREISGINQNMDKSISHLAERQSPQAASRQQFAMTSVNNLALMLSEVLKQMQEQKQQQKQGKGSCSKPGAKSQPKPSAASMKKMQEQINQQIKKMKEEMEKEGGPQKGNKGEGGNSMSKDLAKTAAQQAALRQQLQKLSQELNKDGKGNTKGLDKLGEMMEQTEKDLVNKNITKETLKRQQEIMTRLLEAENAEREREMDEKRESKETKNDNYSNPAQFFEYKRLKQKEAELLKTVPPSLSPFYKNKVSDYFNNIEE
jgi:hypothetical protein